MPGTEATAADVVAAVQLVVPFWKDVVDTIWKGATVIGVLGIPVTIFLVGWFSEKRRATLHLVHEMATGLAVVERIYRLYQYRLYEEARAAASPDNPVVLQINPYEGTGYSLLFDTVTVLNTYEAMCVEVSHKTVNEDILYRTTKDMVIGLRDVVLKRYELLTGIDGSAAYPYLDECADRWHFRAKRERHKVHSKIPPMRDT
ncbi:MAG: hypothetical protein IIA72_15110 [Proteobacteria bacterium]|nr:hypothetical protein [Pseudomonadota bacterium]